MAPIEQATVRPIVYYEYLQGHSARAAADNICAAFKGNVVHHSMDGKDTEGGSARETKDEESQRCHANVPDTFVPSVHAEAKALAEPKGIQTGPSSRQSGSDYGEAVEGFFEGLFDVAGVAAIGAAIARSGDGAPEMPSRDSLSRRLQETNIE
ncbi:unnamed protein product [Darwinula stevensoni]|uniref:Mos1 transposase HTH domain-containing protein n=1 Tax=Darwinula stevensoni TaxID=69355 RepID=A0A7R8X9L7_9CRUS|nr:unnamed protein product [Darwinula stevensoni]CAG0882689.1 unnamed protein product [Darwinula stevensoni]